MEIALIALAVLMASEALEQVLDDAFPRLEVPAWAALSWSLVVSFGLSAWSTGLDPLLTVLYGLGAAGLAGIARVLTRAVNTWRWSLLLKTRR